MGTVEIKYFIRTDNEGSDCSGEATFDKGYWESLTKEERESEMKEVAFNHVDWAFWSSEND